MARTSKVNDKGQYWCGYCKQFKDLKDFNPVPPSQRGQKAQYCKACGLQVHFLTRQKRKLKAIGPDAYLAELDKEKERLKTLYQLLFKYKQENT